MKNIEDESEEELENLYNLLSEEGAKKQRKSRSIDTFEIKRPHRDQNTKYFDDRNKNSRNKKAIYEAYKDIDEILESRADG